MRFETVKQMLTDNLPAPFDDILIEPGPRLPSIPGSFILVTGYGGAGMDVDGLIDQPSFQLRAVGDQNSYQSAEDLAEAADFVFLSWFSKKVGPVWVASIVRVGGAPSPLLVDDADRHHFVCSYTAAVESAVA